MKIVSDFFNKLAKELDTTFFPDVKYYMDNENTQLIHRTVELFNNGCLGYGKMIDKLSQATGDNKENIHTIVSKYIEDFEGYEYDCEDEEIDASEGVETKFGFVKVTTAMIEDDNGTDMHEGVDVHLDDDFLGDVVGGSKYFDSLSDLEDFLENNFDL